MKKLGIIFIILAVIILAFVIIFFTVPRMMNDKWTSRTTWEDSKCVITDTSDYQYEMYIVGDKKKDYISNSLVKDKTITSIKTESNDAKLIATVIKNNTFLISDNGLIKIFDVPGEELFDTEVYFDDTIKLDYKNNRIVGFFIRGGYYNLSKCTFGKIGFLD